MIMRLLAPFLLKYFASKMQDRFEHQFKQKHQNHKPLANFDPEAEFRWNLGRQYVNVGRTCRVLNMSCQTSAQTKTQQT